MKLVNVLQGFCTADQVKFETKNKSGVLEFKQHEMKELFLLLFNDIQHDIAI